MTYTQEVLKSMALNALEEQGYHDALWGQEGGKEAREDKGYYSGYADALVDIYNVKGFSNSQEAIDAYEKGEARYYNRKEEDEE